MMRTPSRLLLCVLLSWPALASAQQASGIAGVVKDASGAVLPGVTVEASSPALIEKVRTVVTDGEGRYNVVDLRPGAYAVTFTLTGFSTVKREGIELTAGFTATVNAEMRVGAIQETITVTGASPLVDTQNTRQQKVLSAETLAALPTSTVTLSNIAVITPGMAGTVNVGGSAGAYSMSSVLNVVSAEPDRGVSGDRPALVETDHHHDEIRLVGIENLARRLRPVGIVAARVAFHVGADQARQCAVPAQDPDVGRFRRRLLEPVGQPVRHRVAEHHHGGERRGIGLAGGWRRLGVVFLRGPALAVGIAEQRIASASAVAAAAARAFLDEGETVVELLGGRGHAHGPGEPEHDGGLGEPEKDRSRQTPPEYASRHEKRPKNHGRTQPCTRRTHPRPMRPLPGHWVNTMATAAPERSSRFGYRRAKPSARRRSSRVAVANPSGTRPAAAW